MSVMDRMDFRIRKISFMDDFDGEENEKDTIRLHFSADDPEDEVDLSGYVPVTKSEFESTKSIDGIIELAKEKIAGKVVKEED